MVGDSTPLVKKLGIKQGTTLFLHGAPADYLHLLRPVRVRRRTSFSSDVDIAHVFSTSEADLSSILPDLRSRMRSDAAIWVSWPKKASKRPTDLTEHRIRALALPLGLVDVKVCAVDAIWSGLKFVLRKANRLTR